MHTHMHACVHAHAFFSDLSKISHCEIFSKIFWQVSGALEVPNRHEKCRSYLKMMVPFMYLCVLYIVSVCYLAYARIPESVNRWSISKKRRPLTVAIKHRDRVRYLKTQWLTHYELQIIEHMLWHINNSWGQHRWMANLAKECKAGPFIATYQLKLVHSHLPCSYHYKYMASLYLNTVEPVF